jgi:dTDP-4-dehydrorhamnose 3,5-epimerase
MDVFKKVLTDAFILKPRVFGDNRGYFFESFNKNAFEKVIDAEFNFIQDNQSISSKGTLRGLHFQKGKAAQSKLVRVIKGAAYDIAVDLRPGSPTFKQWHGVELTEENHLQFFIPKGFAHAFIALEDNTILQYKVDNYHSKENDGGIIWNDEELGIIWPNLEIVLSDKDKTLPKLNQINLNSLW